ncbi:MAG: haloacid dehalogenase-like hydrolase [Clostridia bacterium]|nr:haloacid dehalogenase-like hydrolase [Clostridia bacterium]
MLIDVYDFDGTIYDGDSTTDFVLFAIRRHPNVLLGLPRIAGAALKLYRKQIGLTEFKSVLFAEMAERMELPTEAGLFWLSPKTKAKLGDWFAHTPRDLPIAICSASPEFEIIHAAKLLGVKTVIGTRVDTATGELIGKNCKAEEKLRRLEQAFGEYEIRAMYTDDAKADGPLLAAAREGYILTHGKVAPYSKA